MATVGHVISPCDWVNISRAEYGNYICTVKIFCVTVTNLITAVRRLVGGLMLVFAAAIELFLLVHT